jgi:hypothetical protein
VPISAISQQREAFCCKKSENRFPVENEGKLFGMVLMAFLLSAIYRGHSMDIYKPHLLSSDDHISFLQLNGRIPFKENKNVRVSILQQGLLINITFSLIFRLIFIPFS